MQMYHDHDRTRRENHSNFLWSISCTSFSEGSGDSSGDKQALKHYTPIKIEFSDEEVFSRQQNLQQYDQTLVINQAGGKQYKKKQARHEERKKKNTHMLNTRLTEQHCEK